LSEQGAALCDTTVHVLARFAETIVFVLIGYGFALYGIGPLANSATSPGGNASSAPGHLLPVLPSSASSHNASSSPGEAVCTPVEPGGQKMEPAFILLTLALCLLSRVCSVFPMAALANTWRSPMHKIKLHEQVVIWFSGLRGAIALALAVEFPTAHEVRGTAGEGNFCYQREHVVACTIVVVLCTVFLMGGFTKPVLKLCGIAMSVENPPESPALKPQQTSKHGWKRQLLRFDRKVIRPVLITGYEGDQQ
jgi:NhaP-type Na+/H+ or K+/H+ antiporter